MSIIMLRRYTVILKTTLRIIKYISSYCTPLVCDLFSLANPHYMGNRLVSVHTFHNDGKEDPILRPCYVFYEANMS